MPRRARPGPDHADILIVTTARAPRVLLDGRFRPDVASEDEEPAGKTRPTEMPTRKMGPGAGATQGSPSDRLDDESGAVVHRRTRRLTVATAVAAHLIGTGVVLVLLVFVLPVPPEFEGWTPGSAQLVLRNLVAAIAYVGVIVPAGAMLGLKQADPATRWLLEERAPTERERELGLGLGLRLLRMQTGLWAGGVVLFYLLNVSTSGLLAFEIAITVALGGVTTAAVAYLLTERNTRSTIARALAGAPPRSYQVPGVATRALFAWALGTAVPVIGVVAIAAVSLALPVSAHRGAVRRPDGLYVIRRGPRCDRGRCDAQRVLRDRCGGDAPARRLRQQVRGRRRALYLRRSSRARGRSRRGACCRARDAGPTSVRPAGDPRRDRAFGGDRRCGERRCRRPLRVHRHRRRG